MKTGLTKKQKVTELFYNAKDSIAEVYTNDTKLKSDCGRGFSTAPDGSR